MIGQILQKIVTGIKKFFQALGRGIAKIFRAIGQAFKRKELMEIVASSTFLVDLKMSLYDKY